MSHARAWEYNIPQRLAVARHVAGVVRLKFQSATPPRPAWFNSGLRAREACRAAFARFFHAHELTGRALRRGPIGYYRAARILNRWAASGTVKCDLRANHYDHCH